MLSTFLVAPAASAAELSVAERQERAINTIFVRTNQYRKEVGLPALKYDARIGQVAQTWAKTMGDSSYLRHSDTFYSDIQKFEYWDVGENIATSTNGIGNEVALLWRYSPGHYANMITKDYTHIGIGVYIDSNDQIWAVQNFARARAEHVSHPVPGAGKPLDGYDTEHPDKKYEREEAEKKARTIRKANAYVKESVTDAAAAYKQAVADYKKAVAAYKETIKYGKSKKANSTTKRAVKDAKFYLKHAKKKYATVKSKKVETDKMAKKAYSNIENYRRTGSHVGLQTLGTEASDASSEAETAADTLREYTQSIVKARNSAKKSVTAKVVKKKKAAVSKWQSKTFNMKKGKAPKAQSIKVKSDAKRVYVYSRHKYNYKGAKYTAWRNMGYLPLKNGRTRILLPAVMESNATVQFRIVVKATKKYASVTTKPLTLRVK